MKFAVVKRFNRNDPWEICEDAGHRPLVSESVHQLAEFQCQMNIRVGIWCHNAAIVADDGEIIPSQNWGSRGFRQEERVLRLEQLSYLEDIRPILAAEEPTLESFQTRNMVTMSITNLQRTFGYQLAA